MSTSVEQLLKKADQLRKAALRLEKKATQTDLQELLSSSSAKGRPFKVFDYAKAREMLERGCTERYTAAALGISPQTLHTWKHRLQWTSPSFETCKIATEQFLIAQAPDANRESVNYQSAVSRIARILWIVIRESRLRADNGEPTESTQETEAKT